MKTKIIVIIILTLLITTSYSIVATENKNTTTDDNPILPRNKFFMFALGDMELIYDEYGYPHYYMGIKFGFSFGFPIPDGKIRFLNMKGESIELFVAGWLVLFVITPKFLIGIYEWDSEVISTSSRLGFC